MSKIDVIKIIISLNLIKIISLFFNPNKIDNLYNPDIAPKKKIEDLIHLAELCIDLLQQNEEHHSEVSNTIFIFLNVFDFLVFK